MVKEGQEGHTQGKMPKWLWGTKMKGQWWERVRANTEIYKTPIYASEPYATEGVSSCSPPMSLLLRGWCVLWVVQEGAGVAFTATPKAEVLALRNTNGLRFGSTG